MQKSTSINCYINLLKIYEHGANQWDLESAELFFWNLNKYSYISHFPFPRGWNYTAATVLLKDIEIGPFKIYQGKPFKSCIKCILHFPHISYFLGIFSPITRVCTHSFVKFLDLGQIVFLMYASQNVHFLFHCAH